MAQNQNASYWRAMLDSIYAQVPALGNVLVVVSWTNDSTSHIQHLQDLFTWDSDGRVRFFASLSDAYDAAESNNNDVIVLDAQSTHSLTAGIAITKNRINFIWFDWGDRLVQQGAKIQLATAATTAYVIKNTWVRNTFKNIKFIQAATAGTWLTVVQEWWEGTVYKNCSMVFGVADNLGSTSAFELVAGSDSASYIDCTIGSDTLLTSVARAVMSIDQVNGTNEFKSNQFRNCTFNISSSSSTAAFIRLSAVWDILFSNLFDRCNFLASVDSAWGIALDEAVQTWTGTVKGCLAFSYPSIFNVTKFSTATSGRNTAIQVSAPAMTATGWIWITPTA